MTAMGKSDDCKQVGVGLSKDNREGWEPRSLATPGASEHNQKIKSEKNVWGHDPKITHRRDKIFIRIAVTGFAPMPPIDSCKSGILWRRWPGLASADGPG